MKNIFTKVKLYVILFRPFTLIAPALGILSGSLIAYGAHPRYFRIESDVSTWIIKITLCTLAAMVLNGASNTINQVYDIDIDRINKPERVLPSGKISKIEAFIVSIGGYLVALGTAFFINMSCFFIFVLAALATLIYSVPPIRIKRFGWAANFTIAVPRGILLTIAGWSVTKPAMTPEAWLIGFVFGLFLFGASSCKDFADIEGDKTGGCKTLPVMYGKEKTCRIIYPFFVLPFVLLISSALSGLLTGNKIALVVLGCVCLFWGHKIMLMLIHTSEKRLIKSHPSWKHMYFLMFFLQLGFIITYII